MPRSRLLRLPSAYLPVAMSIAAIAAVLVHVVAFGADREMRGGAALVLWQLLMALQLPVIGYFAIRWVPRVPRRASGVVAMQVGAALAALAPVFYLLS